jgi:exonuclease SbcC
MKLRSLSMQLFRQHLTSEIVFPDGLVGIVGSNGSGKTTIVEAIGFALFGSRALRGKVEDVRTRTAPARTGRGKRDQDLKVSLALEHDGVIFRIERTLSEASLFVAGESTPVAAGNRDVSTRISSIVGMSYEEFVSTYCTEQKGLEFLSGKKGATEREKFIVRMMGYDRLEEVQDLLRTDRKEKRAVLQGYEASLGTREELEQRLQAEQGELAEIREKHAEAARSLQKAEEEFRVLREKMVKLEDLRARFTKEKEGAHTLKVRHEERVKRIAALTDGYALTKEELERALKPLAGERNLTEALKDLRKRLSTDRNTREVLGGKIREAELAWRGEVSKVTAQRDGLKHQLSQLESKATKFEKLSTGGECPTCGQELGDSFDQVRKHFSDEKSKLTKQLKLADAAIKDSEQVSSEIVALRAESSAVDERIAHLESKMIELTSCEQLQSKLLALDEERKALEIDMKLAEENMLRAQQRMAEVRFSEDEYLREKGAHDAAQRVLEVVRLQRVRLEGEVNTKGAMVERSKGDILKFDERRTEVEKLRREVRVFDECDRVLTDFRKFVNSSIRPRMAELASEYLADLTDGRYSAVELDDDFTPTVVEDGEPKRVISGGEEDILNLCMRISLSHMLAERAGQHFSLLMLDEVFGSLDEGRRGNVLSLLEKLRNRFEQILIITHLDDVKDGVQHLIQVDYDERTGSAVVRSSDDELEVAELAYNV